MKKYYCDYCQTYIPGNISARKLHAQGHTHQQIVNNHYRRFKFPYVNYKMYTDDGYYTVPSILTTFDHLPPSLIPREHQTSPTDVYSMGDTIWG